MKAFVFSSFLLLLPSVTLGQGQIKTPFPANDCTALLRGSHSPVQTSRDAAQAAQEDIAVLPMSALAKVPITRAIAQS